MDPIETMFLTCVIIATCGLDRDVRCAARAMAAMFLTIIATVRIAKLVFGIA